jgi:hypothetical protein
VILVTVASFFGAVLPALLSAALFARLGRFGFGGVRESVGLPPFAGTTLVSVIVLILPFGRFPVNRSTFKLSEYSTFVGLPFHTSN